MSDAEWWRLESGVWRISQAARVSHDGLSDSFRARPQGGALRDELFLPIESFALKPHQRKSSSSSTGQFQYLPIPPPRLRHLYSSSVLTMPGFQDGMPPKSQASSFSMPRRSTVAIQHTLSTQHRSFLPSSGVIGQASSTTLFLLEEN